MKKAISKKLLGMALGGSLVMASCNKQAEKTDTNTQVTKTAIQDKLDDYKKVRLSTDMKLSEKQRKMIGYLMRAAELMDAIFWKEAYGNKDEFLASIKNQDEREFALIQYGPWDRLDDNKPFIEGVGAKPLGANFYPTDMSKEEFEKSSLTEKEKKDQYSIIQRKDGKLVSVPYHVAFEREIKEAADMLKMAAEICEEPQLKKYLELRSKALLTDSYKESDMAWLDMKENTIDVVIGPIENYEDKLFGTKAAHECYILIKDLDWSKKLAKYAAMLPELQKGLPVKDQYKKEMPGSNSDLNAYDVVYYAGDCNSGSKTIAINLPNDEEVQLAKGTRRLQLKNAMKAKYDEILVPISNLLIAEEQRKHITFNAFFGNTMFHEVAHGLGIKKTINNKGTVREALGANYSALEEGKADILGLYMITKLYEKKEVEGELMDYYVTFLAGIFRSVRFGAASAHGQANMVRFNYFAEAGAFTRDEATGTYKVNFEAMTKAINGLSEVILTLQGDGDVAGVEKLMKEKGMIKEQLQKDLEKLKTANIPVDVVFEQGGQVLGL